MRQARHLDAQDEVNIAEIDLSDKTLKAHVTFRR